MSVIQRPLAKQTYREELDTLPGVAAQDGEISVGRK